jgi:hypothetical protein
MSAKQCTQLYNAEVALLMASEAAVLCRSFTTQTAVIHHLTAAIRSEKCVVRRSCHSANAIECTHTNLDSLAYYTPRLYGIVYCS